MRLLRWLFGTIVYAHWASCAIASETIDFNRDVRPILSDNCFQCHGPDDGTRAADLRLDVADDGSVAGGSSVLVAGDAQGSPLFQRIVSTDADVVMPPPSSHKRLTAQQIETVQRWIDQGGKYDIHWSLIPLRSCDQLAAEIGFPGAAGQPWAVIDRLIQVELDQRQLAAMPLADRVTLLRRLHLDVTGLAPSPDEVRDYLKDDTPNAYQSQVDRLLNSPHFGERLAMWWLDLVRYADSVGYHGDQDVSVSPFRDYVIDSFNDNKPFDQFTVEQLAGDLLPQATLEQQIASGYNRLGMMSAEGGVQDKEYLAKYIAERVRNVSGAWMGMTMGCCECHDHKFDPLSMREFYQMEAFFADIQERGLYAGANSDGNWGPSIQVPSDQQRQELHNLDQQISRVREVLNQATVELQTAQTAWEAQQIRGSILRPVEVRSEPGATLTIRDDQSILTSGQNPGKDIDSITVDDLPKGVAAPSLEAIPKQIEDVLAIPVQERSQAQTQSVAEYYRSISPLLQPVRDELQSLEKSRQQLVADILTTLITVAVEPRTIRVLARGNWMDETGEIVGPAFPAAISVSSVEVPDHRRMNRLDLAIWLVAPDNPLTARVLVNRLWKLYFGVGLSPSLDDAGAQGQPPSHPLLLDYLARQLIESGWDLKQTIRGILMSQTYQRSSQATPELLAADPSNRWLARQGRFRLDAELVRDNALAASGLLVRHVGGRSVKPYQPAGYWAYLNFPAREWTDGSGDQLYRRGLYTHWQRQYLHPGMLAFDAPNREECAANRPRSNTPLQSLVLLNDPTYVEAARALAAEILQSNRASDEERLDFGCQQVLSRSIMHEEMAPLLELLTQARQAYLRHPEQTKMLAGNGLWQAPDQLDPTELSAWTAVTRVLLNLHECISRY